ncbi:MAG: malonate transporter [Rhodobacteraceae bacterium]|nr:MAG: malonate transporter [Paracoccaceae bacterium]
MILQLLNVVMPVFLVIGAGYIAVKLDLFKISAVDGLMTFTQGLAIPCLLFLNIMRLDFAAVFDWRLMVSFYTGAIISFTIGIIGARTLFRRRPGDSVAIGFAAMFSNSLLLGLPIMERAYGAGALAGNFAIISIHAPLLYLIGITMMEASRADGRGVAGTVQTIIKAMFRNTLMIGLALGFAVNITNITLPEPLISAVEMIARAALPAALFALGGTLTRYSLRASLGEATMISTLKLMVHPAIAYVMCTIVFDLPIEFTRSAVVTAAMAPGINAYVFANMYNRAKGAAASAVLLGTVASIFSASMWLVILG